MHIILIFTRNNHWFSHLICLLTGSRWSHVAIGIFKDPAVPDSRAALYGTPRWFDGGPLTHVIDSRFDVGVDRPRTLGSFLAAYPDHEAIQVPCPHSGNGALWLAGQIGKPYDGAGLWGFLMPWRQWQDSNAWYCFELAARTLFFAGCPYRSILESPMGGVSGRQLYNYAKDFGHVVTL